MTLSLSEICSSAVSTAVIKGEISNASYLPVALRRSMHEWFRIKQQLHDKTVLQLLCQPGFFDGFTTINMRQGDFDDMNDYCFLPAYADGSNGRSLASAVTIFKTIQNLAENITDLCLGVAGGRDYALEKMHDCPTTEHLVSLLGLCKNLKRLRLVAGSGSNLASLPDLHKFAETANVSFPALEHLSLMSYCADWTGTQFPKRLFESLQSLQVCSISCDQAVYSDILACCQHTLICLDVSDKSEPGAIISPVPIRMPKLSTLSFKKNGFVGAQIKFDDIVGHCPNLTAATLRICDQVISETDLATLADLSKRVRLSIQLLASLVNVSKIAKAVGEYIYELYLEGEGYDGRDCNSILSNTPNLRCLLIASASMFPHTVLLQNHFADKARAAMLTQFCSANGLSSTALRCLFTDCFNLRYLILNLWSHSEDISNYLQTWIENGARPAVVNCRTLIPLEPRTVCALLKASGRELNRLHLRVRRTEANIGKMVLNVLRNHCPFLQGCQITFHAPSESFADGSLNDNIILH